MTSGVEVSAPEARISEAAAKMRYLDIGPLPVYEGERLVGMLTERDSTVRAVAAGRDPLTTQDREVMTPDMVSGFDAHEVRTLCVGWHRTRCAGDSSCTGASSSSAWSPWAIWPCMPGLSR